MTEHTSIRGQTCPNTHCRFHRVMLEGNVVVHAQKYPRFKCTACNTTWVSHRNHVRYGCRKDAQKVESVRRLLKQGWSVRKTAQAVGISPGTVQRWKAKLSNNPLIS